MKIILLTPLLIAGIVSGCTPEADVPKEEPVVAALVIENHGRGNSGALRDTTEAVYRTVSDWNTISAQLSPLEPFGQFDTTQVMILLAALPTTSGGFAVQFESVEMTEDELVATYEFSVPGHDCLTVSALSLAFQAVRVPQSDLPVRFVREDRYYSCSTR